MDRPIAYYGALARALDILKLGQNAMVGLGGLAQSILGTSAAVSDFTLVPTSPASLTVTLTPGAIYQQANIEASAISLLGVDTRTIVKQGLLLDATGITLVPPATVGYAQNVLVEVQYADLDDGAIPLNYYNAANPAVPLVGPGGNGLSQATSRRGVVAIQAKYGVAATAGTQVTPTPDAGWTGLFVVTLAYGQTTITAGNIATYPGAPFIPKLTSLVSNGLPVGTSTTKAPKLVGLTAGGSGQSITTSAPNTLSMSPLSGANNLSGNTSTWASNKLTVGVGEAGLWLIQGYVGWPLPVGGFFVSMAARKNGSAMTPTVGSTMSGGVTGDAQAVTFCAVAPLAVGDQIDFYAYQQSGSTVATLYHNVSMFLLSAV